MKLLCFASGFSRSKSLVIVMSWHSFVSKAIPDATSGCAYLPFATLIFLVQCMHEGIKYA
jgi:hypothetical protein